MNISSVSGKNWIYKKFDSSDVKSISEKYSLGEISAKLLSIRRKNINIKIAEKESKTIKEQFDDELSYCKNKYNLQINFINDNS